MGGVANRSSLHRVGVIGHRPVQLDPLPSEHNWSDESDNGMAIKHFPLLLALWQERYRAKLTQR